MTKKVEDGYFSKSIDIKEDLKSGNTEVPKNVLNVLPNTAPPRPLSMLLSVSPFWHQAVAAFSFVA